MSNVILFTLFACCLAFSSFCQLKVLDMRKPLAKRWLEIDGWREWWRERP